MRTLFLIPIYPKLSETFILEELHQLEKFKAKGLILAFKREKKCYQQPLINKIKFKKLYFTNKVIKLKNLIKTPYVLIKNFFIYPKPFLKIISWFFKSRMLLFSNLKVFVKVLLVLEKIVSFKPDIIVAHYGLEPTDAAIFFHFLLNIPFVCVLHTNDLFVRNYYFKEKLKLAELVIVKSKFSLNYLKKQLKVDTSNVKVLPLGGVNIKFFKPCMSVKDKKKKKIISVGRLVEKKGFEYLIRACLQLKKEGIKFECIIIGGGPKRNKLIRLIKNKGLENKIEFLGCLPHNQKFLDMLCSADVFVLPSIIVTNNDRDILANSLLEAMACGLPVVTTKISAINELIKDKKNGFLVPQKNSSVLANCMKKVLTMDERRLRIIRKNARQTIVKNFNTKKQVKKLYRVLEQIVNIDK